ncbi:MAG: hypothetical protein GYB68_19985 [Chloroflexi bacterium]|nr:hypothetical protein [Chloroflexota bacterium]
MAYELGDFVWAELPDLDGEWPVWFVGALQQAQGYCVVVTLTPGTDLSTLTEPDSLRFYPLKLSQLRDPDPEEAEKMQLTATRLRTLQEVWRKRRIEFEQEALKLD